MAGGKKRKLADDSMADYGTTDKEFDSDNEFDSEEVMRNADLHPGGGSDNEFDSEEVMRNADLHPGGGSDNEFDSEEVMRNADLHPGGGSDNEFDSEELMRMTDLHPPGGSDDEFDSEKLMRMADLLLTRGSDDEFDSEELMVMADLPRGSDKIVNFQKFQRMNKSNDLCESGSDDDDGLWVLNDQLVAGDELGKKLSDFCDSDLESHYSSDEEPYDEDDFDEPYIESADVDEPQFNDSNFDVSINDIITSLSSLQFSTETHNGLQAESSSTDKYIQVTNKTAHEVQAEIEKLAFTIALSIIEGKEIEYDVPSRARGNQHFDASIGAIVLKTNMSKRSYHRQPRRVAITLRVLAIINNILIDGLKITKRDLFYWDKGLFKTQRHSDAVLDDICCMIGCTRNALHIVAADRGSVIGHLSYEVNGQKFDCSVNSQPIPSSVSLVTEIEGTAKFILLVEKDAVFMRLAYDKFHDTVPCIIMTGKGQPDVASRMFLRRLKKEFNIPVFALMDCDPAGLKIMLVYAYGSRSMSFDAENLMTPGIQWLGLLPSDLDQYHIPKECRSSMTDSDVNATKNLLKEEYVLRNSDMVKELQLMLDSKQTAEIECLNTHNARFLTQQYLPRKLHALSSLKTPSYRF